VMAAPMERSRQSHATGPLAAHPIQLAVATSWPGSSLLSRWGRFSSSSTPNAFRAARFPSPTELQTLPARGARWGSPPGTHRGSVLPRGSRRACARRLWYRRTQGLRPAGTDLALCTDSRSVSWFPPPVTTMHVLSAGSLVRSQGPWLVLVGAGLCACPGRPRRAAPTPSPDRSRGRLGILPGAGIIHLYSPEQGGCPHVGATRWVARRASARPQARCPRPAL
jgi:hypothetical protein